jgi:hypothetical protein
MPLATTYAGWLQLIRDWLDIAGPDVTDAQISYSLQLGQDELNKSLNSWRMEKSAPLTAITSNVPIDMSGITDFSRIQLITGGTFNQPLQALAFNELMAMLAAITAGAQAPTNYCYYAIQGQSLYTVPMPAAGDVFTVFYYQLVPSLSVSVATNVFSQYHEEALLYASLVAASQFIAEDERTPAWVALAANAVETINLSSKGSKMGSTPLVRQFETYGPSRNSNIFLGN